MKNLLVIIITALTLSACNQPEQQLQVNSEVSKLPGSTNTKKYVTTVAQILELQLEEMQAANKFASLNANAKRFTVGDTAVMVFTINKDTFAVSLTEPVDTIHFFYSRGDSSCQFTSNRKTSMADFQTTVQYFASVYNAVTEYEARKKMRKSS